MEQRVASARARVPIILVMHFTPASLCPDTAAAF